MPRATEADIERGLTALAFHRDSEKASAATGIPDSTLRTWRHRYPDRYEHTQQRLEPLLAEGSEATAHMLLEIQHQAGKRTLAGLQDMDPKDAAKVIQQAAVAYGIHVDKTRLLRNQPTQITETRNVDEIIRKLSASQVVDSTAQEVKPLALGPG